MSPPGAPLFDDLRHAGRAPPDATIGPSQQSLAEHAELQFWSQLSADGARYGFTASGPPWLLSAAEACSRALEANGGDARAALAEVLKDYPPSPSRRGLGLLLEDSLQAWQDAS